MAYDCGRIIQTTLLGYPLEPVSINEDETGLIINEPTRVALIILLGSMSRDEYTKHKLSSEQADLLRQFHQMVQT